MSAQDLTPEERARALAAMRRQRERDALSAPSPAATVAEGVAYDPTTQPYDEPLRHVDSLNATATVDMHDSDILAAISKALVAAEEHDFGPEATVLSVLRSLGLLTGSIGKDWSWPLPCDVLVAPKTVIGRGVSLGTLVTALKQRERWIAEGETIPRLTKADPAPSGPADARVRVNEEFIQRWIARAYREPEDKSKLDAPRFTRWNMSVAFLAGMKFARGEEP